MQSLAAILRLGQNLRMILEKSYPSQLVQLGTGTLKDSISEYSQIQRIIVTLRLSHVQ